MITKKNAPGLLLLILVLGTFLRVWGINFGLPSVYHADEPIVVNHAMAYGTGDLNPHFFAIPPLASYCLFLLYGAYFIIGKALHIFTTADSFALAFLKDPSVFYLMGRVLLGTLPGIATIYAVYVFGRKLFSERAGIFSALFLSVAFIHVQNCHYIYVDTIMVLFVVLTAIMSVDIIRTNSVKYYILAGAFAGVAAAIKYNAAIVFIIIVAAHLLNSGLKRAGRLAVCVSAAIVMFLAFNPYSVLDMGNFVNSIVRQAGAEYPLGALYHLRYSLLEGCGIWILSLGIIGMLYYGFKKPRTHLALISFPVLFYVVLCLFSQPHERYILPLVPFLIVYAASVVSEKIKNRYAVILLIAAIVIPNTVKSAYSDMLFARDDVRTAAKVWIEKNIENGSRIAVEHSFFCPRLNQAKEQIEEKFHLIKGAEGIKDKRLKLALAAADEKRPSYKLFYLKDDHGKGTGFLFERPDIGFSIEELKGNGIEYVVMHIGSKADTRKDFYQKMLDDAILVQEFTPYKDKNKQFAEDIIMQTGGPFLGRELFSREENGYIIKVFKLKRP